LIIGFGKDLGFGANLDVRNFAAGDVQAVFGHGNDGRYKFAEGAVAAAGGLTDGFVGQVDDAFVRLHTAY
jgi:hypothetical protein